jgi:predicted regulator of Ras-like GTPase activity (Roadblock/LC7/MglB family)
MAKLDELLKEMAAEVPGLIACAVVGMDGLGLAHYATDPNFDVEIADAQFAMVMQVGQKTVAQLGKDVVEDNLLTTNNAFLLTRFIGDGSMYLGIAVDRKASNLGTIRLVARNFADVIWDAVPKRRR